MKPETINKLNEQFTEASPHEILQYFLAKYGKEITLANSMGLEDQVLTDMIAKIDATTPIFTLDTGRVFPEIYDLIQKTDLRYKIHTEVFFPDYQKVQQMVAEKGINLFYDSVDNRKLCCSVRKLEPLRRAFAGKKAWICGLRKEQSVTRQDMQPVEWDEQNRLVKVNPLIDWSEQQVWDYIEGHKVPYNPLHKKGYPSVGCQPCTRAIMEGEDIRAGRWWWENPDTKECGLHKK